MWEDCYDEDYDCERDARTRTRLVFDALHSHFHADRI